MSRCPASLGFVGPDASRESAQLLARAKANFDLELRADGRFFFEGDELSHPGVSRYFRRHIDLDPGARVVVRVGELSAPLRVVDACFRVRHVSFPVAQKQEGRGGPDPLQLHLHLHLDDERRVSVPREALFLSDDDRLYARVPTRSGALGASAAFTNAALVELEPFLRPLEADESSTGSAGYLLTLGQSLDPMAIAREPGPPERCAGPRSGS